MEFWLSRLHARRYLVPRIGGSRESGRNGSDAGGFIGLERSGGT